jgi:hypothetical protein
LHLSKATVESPLNFGGAIHAGFADLLRGKTLDESLVSALAALKDQEYRDKEWRTPDRVLHVVSAFAEELKRNPLEVLIAPNGEPVVEAEVAFPMLVNETTLNLVHNAGYSGVVACGIIDVIVRQFGRIYICDHKTDSGSFRSPKGEQPGIDSGVWNKFKPHGATPLYLWLAQRYLHESNPISGVLINLICLGKPTKEFPEGRTLFGRQTFEWTPDEILESLEDLETVIQEYCRAKIEGGFRRNPDACHLYNRPCPYWDLCKTPRGFREQLKGLYVEDRWNPLTARKTERNEGQ